MFKKIQTRTFNNILIFTVLGLFFVLNFDKFFGNETDVSMLVPEGEYIINMQINQVEIEKAGQQWRIDPQGMQPETKPSKERLSELVSAWQQVYIEPADIVFEGSVFGSPDVLVLLSLAGESKQKVVALNIVEEQLFLVVNKQVYVLLSPSIQSLLEPIVIVRQ